MKKLIPLLFLLACDATSFNVAETSRSLEVGDPCGDCNAWVWDGDSCESPYRAELPTVLVSGLAPGDTGTRTVYHTGSYGGSDNNKIKQAGLAAAAVSGAVVIDTVLTLTASGLVYDNVLYTGGGVRRACGPQALTTAAALSTDSCVSVDNTTGFGGGTHTFSSDGTFGGFLGISGAVTISGAQICKTSGTWGFAIPSGSHVAKTFTLLQAPTVRTGPIIFDSVLFDGGGDCNATIHDWRYNDIAALKYHQDEVRNSWFYDTPSEALTLCGSTIKHNVAIDLGGSLTHKSCSVSPTDETFVDVMEGNYIESVNLLTDAVLGHSEGAFTFSANSRKSFYTGNVLLGGEEGVWGYMQPEDEDQASVHDCAAHFPRLIEFAPTTDPTTFRFVDDELIDVGPPIGP